MPLISVIMPVKNGERFLAQAISSVLAQSFRDFELLVVLDRCTDGSASIATKLAGEDGRVFVLGNRGDGLVDALGTGIAASTGELVARLDADDRMRAGRLERQSAVLLAGAEIGLVGSAAIVIDGEGQEIGRLRVPTTDVDIRRRLPRGNPFVHSAVTMRRSALVSAGGYRDRYPHNEDYDLWLRLAVCGRLANLADPLVDHRRHRGAVSQRFEERQRHERRVCFLDWELAQGLLSARDHQRLLDLLDRMHRRISAIAADPAAWRSEDGDLLEDVLPRLGSADSRRLSRLALSAVRAGRLSHGAMLGLILRARVLSRFGYRRVVKAAAKRLSVVGPGRPGAEVAND